ncbi:hypothetical protein POX_e06558 [Penicillium oxalicum]|uniref:hypothetical protein n=1 Tax=Penicillium oxalicum TaxID=69781 RepID=UPI0020B83356|nr:hypothetical protein POX_e06558 [Penicillium oxalicum]KAI2788540.1 hypothetical protein POX_e06558 [Penicillium oxalicum]
MDFEDDESTDDGSEYNGLDDSEQEGWWREDESEDLDCEEDIEDYEYTTSGDTTRSSFPSPAYFNYSAIAVAARYSVFFRTWILSSPNFLD